ncbi:hypothetical protein E2562_021626 [Oryza meyeriana var. granulata]|uniref:Uncharacterized protein n=1 Tax=Oryza meyeriana var. granulata TaxID=110450 RepID=A0A6G1DZR3_9ORYZ|nr:hypothetical protein E2562_021626 [Oryza meyeriana var. granulata]
MQDLSRAPATALCRGISVSSPADAAAADLQQFQNYLRRIRAARAGADDASGEGGGEPRTRPARGAGRRVVLAAEAAARAKDAIFLETERDEQVAAAVECARARRMAAEGREEDGGFA